jgi:class 3 adenylate cyclase
VLFCDVVGSTSLGESVDPEALQALLAPDEVGVLAFGAATCSGARVGEGKSTTGLRLRQPRCSRAV